MELGYAVVSSLAELDADELVEPFRVWFTAAAPHLSVPLVLGRLCDISSQLRR